MTATSPDAQPNRISRRTFFKMGGAVAAATVVAGTGGCAVEPSGRTDPESFRRNNLFKDICRGNQSPIDDMLQATEGALIMGRGMHQYLAEGAPFTTVETSYKVPIHTEEGTVYTDFTVEYNPDIERLTITTETGAQLTLEKDSNGRNMWRLPNGNKEALARALGELPSDIPDDYAFRDKPKTESQRGSLPCVADGELRWMDFQHADPGSTDKYKAVLGDEIPLQPPVESRG